MDVDVDDELFSLVGDHDRDHWHPSVQDSLPSIHFLHSTPPSQYFVAVCIVGTAFSLPHKTASEKATARQCICSEVHDRTGLCKWSFALCCLRRHQQRRLHDMGVSGCIFDWLRMLYARMSYMVKLGDVTSPEFKAFASVLIGGPALPALWNLYMADFCLMPDNDDPLLSSICMSLLEHADDAFLASYTALGL